MQTTIADLLEMISQLDLTTVVDVPPAVAALVAGVNTPAAAQPAPPTPTAQSITTSPATVPAPSQPAAATPAATQGLPAASMTTGAANLPLPLTSFAAVFRCPNCDSVHFLAPVTGNSPPAVPPPAAPDAPPRPSTPAQWAVPPLAPSTPFATSTNAGCSGRIVPLGTPSGSAVASSSTAGLNNRWYSVTFGRQIGVFRDWFGVVEPLVNGVPGWKCKSFSTLAGATTHFNACAAAGVTGVYVD